MIFDQTVRDSQRDPVDATRASPTPTGCAKADTIGELADKIGIDRAALEATVDRYNEHAAQRRGPRLRPAPGTG